ncbi:hypothetical protein [Hoyosella subflava]|uniref:AB hydrolase-1 domain-containing protein n=1 Tax=Hoyosella subflava (strain DSM 45089 / JCM 17490 / NBRC 109087 / DQS3-9A1) TaxID=443218 RepID=F6ENY6_HOYSD|nr:hypothetical protein [Hoyosella subflava]AEF40452.1 hypothetical protein AS9A_2003 [Hoyosella subflava DQS3-9A1]
MEQASPATTADVFRDEITRHTVVTDPKTGDEYRFYLLNRAYEGRRPVVIYNGFGSTPNTTLGQQYLWEYASALDRPIIAPMAAHVRRRVHRRIFGDGHARALARITNDKLHVAGMSWGGVAAYSVAETLTDQTDHLVTLSSVGTLDHLTEYVFHAARMARSEGPVIRAALKVVAQDFDPRDLEHPPPTMDPLSKFRRALIMRRRSLEGVAHTLHPSTTWHDIIGENDLFTGYQQHAAAVLRRNILYPGTASLTLIRNHGHMWAHMKPVLALALRRSLAQKESGVYREVDILRARSDFLGVDPDSVSGQG